MNLKHLIANVSVAAVLAFTAHSASADLTPFKDYSIGEELVNVTTVKVDSNMIDKYLEGLRATWVTGSEAAKAVGQIKDYSLWVSQMPASGDFNVILVTTYANADALQPSEERFDAFMKQWGEENEKRTNRIVQTYPEIREITGEYAMRQITIK